MTEQSTATSDIGVGCPDDIDDLLRVMRPVSEDTVILTCDRACAVDARRVRRTVPGCAVCGEAA